MKVVAKREERYSDKCSYIIEVGKEQILHTRLEAVCIFAEECVNRLGWQVGNCSSVWNDYAAGGLVHPIKIVKECLDLCGYYVYRSKGSVTAAVRK